MADPIFIAVAVLTVGTAIIALEARELIYGAISLAISMLGIAGFFAIRRPRDPIARGGANRINTSRYPV